MRFCIIIFVLVSLCEIPESINGVPAKAPTYRPTGTPNKPTTKPTNKPTTSHPTFTPSKAPSYTPSIFVCPAGQYSPTGHGTTCINCPAGTSSVAGGSCTNCPVLPHVQSSVAGDLCLDTCDYTLFPNCAVALKSGPGGACECASCNDGSVASNSLSDDDTVATGKGCPISTCYGAAFDLFSFVSGNVACTCTEAVFPPGVRVLANYAFNSCPISTAVIPDTVVSLGKGAFLFCYYLSSVNIPSGITEIGDGTFYNTAFTSITIPASVTTIGDSAFMFSALTFITIPTSVTTIGHSAFMYSALTCVSFPKAITSIGTEAFTADSSLLNVTVPTGIKYGGVVNAISNSFDTPPFDPSGPTVVKIVSPASSYVQVPCP